MEPSCSRQGLGTGFQLYEIGDTLSLMPDAGGTLFTYPGYGHMDPIWGTDRFGIVEQPLL